MRVGFIGLGHMGAPMCEQVLRAGFAVTAFDLRTETTLAAWRSAPRPRRRPRVRRDRRRAGDHAAGPAAVEEVLLGGALAALSRARSRST